MARIIHSRQRPSRTALLFATIFLPLTSLAQIVNFASIPCAQGCSAFVAAQNQCIPPITDAPSTSCFCSSSYMAPLRQGQTTGVCDGFCSAADMQVVLQYFQGLCNNQVAQTTQAATTAAAAPTTRRTTGAGGAVTTVTVPAKTTTSTAKASGNASSQNLNAKAKPWIQDHYGWVIMIIILVLAAIGGIILGVWFKRRHRRKNDIKNRDSTLGTADAIQALRDPHPVPSSSMASRQGITPVGAPPMHQRYNSTGSIRGAPGPSSLGPHAFGAGVRSPGSSTSDVKGKARADEIERQTPARRSSSKLQRKSSGATTSPTAPRSPTSPILPQDNHPRP